MVFVELGIHRSRKGNVSSWVCCEINWRSAATHLLSSTSIIVRCFICHSASAAYCFNGRPSGLGLVLGATCSAASLIQRTFLLGQAYVNDRAVPGCK